MPTYDQLLTAAAAIGLTKAKFDALAPSSKIALAQVLVDGQIAANLNGLLTLVAPPPS